MNPVIGIAEIKATLQSIDPMPLIEEGFVAFCAGKAVVPPVGELIFSEPPGDSHIKYGFISGDDVFAVKVANYFPENTRGGRPADDGVIALFDRRTGALRAVLVDHGYLTHIRTAAAGAVVAKHLAPRKVRRIGMIGCGAQARHQLRFLTRVTQCRDVSVYGRDRQKVQAYEQDMEAEGFAVAIAESPAAVAAECNLIVTCTAAREPLLLAKDIRPGTHITAMGADSGDKQELDPAILGRADIVVVDSIAHAAVLGELHHAIAGNHVRRQDVHEIGHVVGDPALGRTNDTQITVADLVGLAVQDIQIAKAVVDAIR